MNKIILIGLAGAISSQLNIGDIVIADKVYQHDMDASPLFPRYEIPLTGMTYYASDSNLTEASNAAVNEFFYAFHNTFAANTLNQFGIRKPKCIVGTIASGDQFISHDKKDVLISQIKANTAAVEMEGAAIGQVCYELNIPFVIIRIISDHANENAKIDFTRFIEDLAKHYSKQIIHNLFYNSKKNFTTT